MMNKERIGQLIEIYEKELLEKVMPFWDTHSIDEEYGGYIHYLSPKGDVISDDKAVWLQARQVWTYARLYNTVEKRQGWLDHAKVGYDFLRKHCFASNGRMYFSVTREGKPLRMRRYYFSETFMVIGAAEYARASGDEEAMVFAKELFDTVRDYFQNPDEALFPSKVDPETRPAIGHAMPMILIATAQILRECDGTDEYDDFIYELKDHILDNFVKEDYKVLLEMVAPNGDIIDTPEGRTINPGHAIETSWFLMHEALYRKDDELFKKACDILEWSFDIGWDHEFGGLLSFVDLKGLPPEKQEWDMKYWWPHNELLYASLLAYHVTGEKKYELMYEMTHDYAFKVFSDDINSGEWYGYLHRDGSVAMDVKGSMYKGCFHVPRQLMYTLLLLRKM